MSLLGLMYVTLQACCGVVLQVQHRRERPQRRKVPEDRMQALWQTTPGETIMYAGLTGTA